MNSTEARADYIAGLRALADLLDQHDELPLPTAGRTTALDWWIWDHEVNDAKATLAAIVRLLPGSKSKTAGQVGATSWFTVEAALHGLRIDINTNRASVCQRVVTGTREVTKTIPDPAAPTVTVTETVEDVEWVCEPLLRTREQDMAEAANDGFLDNAEPDVPGADDYLADVSA